MRYIIDIETNDLPGQLINYKKFPYKLLPTGKLFVVVIKNIDTGEVKVANNNEITKEWINNSLHDCTELIGHNIIKFDLPMLALFNVLDYKIGELNEFDTIFNRPITIIDTLILSRCLNPDRKDGHSLDTWGRRVGEYKIDFRKICIDKGYIKDTDPKGVEFRRYVPEMTTYCMGDVNSNHKVYEALLKEKYYNKNLDQALKQENKLADRAFNRENLGFWFDKDLAEANLLDLNTKMTDIENYIIPLLPPKPMNIGELKEWTLPKKQINAAGLPTALMLKYADKIKAPLIDNVLFYKDRIIPLPHHEPLESHIKPEIANYDHIKMHLLSLEFIDDKFIHLYDKIEYNND